MAEESSVTGWVATEQGMADRRAMAGRLVGKRIVEVQYVDLDYRGWDLGHHDQTKRRAITDAREWRVPTWDAGQFHHVDLGIEFADEDGKTWSVTWDLPGYTESLRLQERSATEAGAAVWDVTDREPWRSCLDSGVTDVQLRYHPWEIAGGGFWCSRISIVFGTSRAEVLLGDRGPGDSLVPSANNIAVLLDPSGLPAWERTDDLV